MLDGYRSVVPIAGDESILSLPDVAGAVGRFDVINIKLDKCGGLTEALLMAAEARRLGLGVMVGNMIGTSPGDGAGLRAGAALRRGRSRRPDLPGRGSRAVGRLPRRRHLGRSGGLGIGAGPMKEAPPWFGQPRGLTILFLTNMWEQFSYYGMRALLVYYMTKQLMLGQGASSFIYGAYTACAYFTPILGGVIADRLLGKRRAVILGGSIMAAGHFMMTFESLFYPALVTIAFGNGLFLPSLPSQIDHLYAAGDPRRSWAYNLYYLGVNVGGFLAPVACGTIGEIYGWHYGFGVAGIGMLAGLMIYLSGQRYLPASAPTPSGVIAGGARADRPACRAAAACRGAVGDRVPQRLRAGGQHRGVVD